MEVLAAASAHIRVGSPRSDPGPGVVGGAVRRGPGWHSAGGGPTLGSIVELAEHCHLATDLLYYMDSYRREFTSRVVAVDGEAHAVALAQTAFFPTGGGQPHDTGRLRFGETEADIIDVVKGKDGVVWHALIAEAPLPNAEAGVEGQIDWDRRHLLIRIHTAQPLLNAVN